MDSQTMSEVEARFSKLRRNLDDGGYLESFGADSLRLVEHLYNDLVTTTDSLQKTLAEFGRYKLAEKGKEAAQRQHLIEVDYFMPQTCPQCVRLRNYIEYGKNPERNPKTVDYIKLADSRIDALQLQLRSLKNREKENMALISSLKNMIETRDTDIEKLRDIIKVRGGCGGGDFNTRVSNTDRSYEMELKAAEMKMQILQLRNLELEEKLKKSIFEEHESYMMGKIPSYLGDKSLANICLEKELDKYPSHDKMTLLEKLYCLEQQLSHCCKEKAILQRKIEECRIKHQMPTKIYASRSNNSQPNTKSRVTMNNPVIQKEKKFTGGTLSNLESQRAGHVRSRSESSRHELLHHNQSGEQRGKNSRVAFDSKNLILNDNSAEDISDEVSQDQGQSAEENNELEMYSDGEAQGRMRDVSNNKLKRATKGFNLRQISNMGRSIKNSANPNRLHHGPPALQTDSYRKIQKHSTNNEARDLRVIDNQNLLKSKSLVAKQLSKKQSPTAKLPTVVNNDEQGMTSEVDDQYNSGDYSSGGEVLNQNEYFVSDGEDDHADMHDKAENLTHPNKTKALKNNPSYTIVNQNQGKQRNSRSNQDQGRNEPNRESNKSGKSVGKEKVVQRRSPSSHPSSSNLKASISKSATDLYQEGIHPGRSIKVSASKKGSRKVMPSVITTPANVDDFGEAVDELLNQYEQTPRPQKSLKDQFENNTQQIRDSDGNYDDDDDSFEDMDELDFAGEDSRGVDSNAIEQSGSSNDISKSQRVSSKPTPSNSQPRNDDRSRNPRNQAESNNRPNFAKRVGFPQENVVEFDDRLDKVQDNRNNPNSSLKVHKQSVPSADNQPAPRLPSNLSNQSVNDNSHHQRENANSRRSTSDQRSSQIIKSNTQHDQQTRSKPAQEQMKWSGGELLPPNKDFAVPIPVCRPNDSQISFSSDIGNSQGISAIQQPSLLSISEFEKERSEYETFRNPEENSFISRESTRTQRPGNNSDIDVYQEPSSNLWRSSESQQRQLNPAYNNPHSALDRTGSTNYHSKSGYHVAGVERNVIGTEWSDGESRDKEFGRGRNYGSDTASIGTANDSATGYGYDSLQVRRGTKPTSLDKGDSRTSLAGNRALDRGNLFKSNVEQGVRKGTTVRTIAVNTEESLCFGLSWGARGDAPFENKQLTDKVSAQQRKIDELQAESSRHQLKSFELQGELERTRHMFQVEKQERELAVAELKRVRDRNSESSARLLLNSSVDSDMFRRGATPMDLEREITNLRSALASLDRDKDEMRAELDRKDEKLARAIQDSSQYVDEISQLKLRLKNAELEISHTGESAKEHHREGEFLKKQLENTRRDLEKILRERDDALKELHKISAVHSKTQTERRGVETELELKCKEADDLRRQVQRYIDEVRRIEELLLDKEEEMETLIQHYRALTVENSNLEAQRTNLEKEAVSIRDSVQDAVHQNISFKTQLASQNALVESLEEEIKRFTEQVSQLENQLASKQEKEHALEHDVKASRDLLYRLEVQMDKLKLDLAEAESKRKQLEVENSELSAHIETLESRLREETDRQTQLEQLVANSREKEFKNQSTASNLSRERDDLAEKLTSLQHRSETLNSEVSRYRLKSIELQNDLDRTRRQLETEKRDRESAINELKRAREQLHSNSANYLIKTALGSSGLSSESPAQYASPEARPNISGTLAEGLLASSSREQSPFRVSGLSSSQQETPPAATSTGRRDEKSEDEPAET